jgi:hypothetical protein
MMGKALNTLRATFMFFNPDKPTDFQPVRKKHHFSGKIGENPRLIETFKQIVDAFIQSLGDKLPADEWEVRILHGQVGVVIQIVLKKKSSNTNHLKRRWQWFNKTAKDLEKLLQDIVKFHKIKGTVLVEVVRGFQL